MEFDWISHKKDNSGKTHIWGLVYSGNSQYAVWGSPGGWINRELYYPNPDINKQINNGFKSINPKSVNARWPTLMADVEMLFIVDRLKK